MQVAELIAKDRWTPIKYKAYEFDDNLLILNSSGSDFSEESIKKYNNVKGINNKILLEVKELLLDPLESVLTFCDSIESAQLFADNTKDSAVVHGGMSKNEREKVLTAFQKGEIRAVYNHSVLGIGYDHPALRTVIMGRPTNSFSIYYQYLGRGVRKCPGKSEFKFVDYGGNVKRFGPVESITVEKHPILGWAMFSGDRLLTGTSMKGAPVYKKDLVPKKDIPKGEGGDFVINIGKFKGQPLSKVKRSYLEYMIFTSGFDFSRGAMKEFYEKTNKYLESTKMEYVK
jgi:DNA repair protein RadD